MVKAMSDSPLLLIVDDDPILRRVLEKAMQRRGYEVLTAENVEQAIVLANQHTPEYAVIDLKMQGASGLTLVQYLHQLDNQTRTVVLTGYASIATAVEAIKLGATHYLAKPANADEIIAASKNEGEAVKKRENTHKMAEANKAFAHFAW